MKILLASDSYRYQTNGIANVVITLAEELRRQGHWVKVLALSESHASHRDGDDYYIGSMQAWYYQDLRMSPARHCKLLEELRQWRPDVVHIHTEGSVLRMGKAIAEETRAPVVMTVHTHFAKYIFGRYDDSRVAELVMQRWGNHVYRDVDEIIVPSRKALDYPQLKEVRDRCTVIPNGIQLERLQKPMSAAEKDALFEKYGLDRGARTLVSVSRISKEKNLEEILAYYADLIRRWENVQLVVVGDGPDLSNLEACGERLGLGGKVRFVGRIPPDEVYQFYGVADVFVCASTFETHSLTYLEATACGVPLVCREDPCLDGVLADGENGYVYRTEEQFIEGVLKILSDDALRAAMRERALRLAMEFGARRFAERTAALYERAVRRGVTG